MTDMHRAWKCRADTERMERESTDPAWLRQQLGLPPKPSLGFTILISCIGALALMGIVVAFGSI